MSDWFEIVVPTPPEGGDEVAGRLVSDLPFASGGVELRDGAVVFWVAPAQCDAALAATRCLVEVLAAEGCPVDPGQVVAVAAVPESEWRDAYKKHFRSVRLTRQLVVVPSWEADGPRADATAHDLVIYLDPGQAFGTGAHASTQLVLQAMQELADAGVQIRRALDVGTGSGILAIAAAKLWPEARVVATDIDPQAVTVAVENCTANGVIDTVAVSGTDLTRLDGLFELVVANIQADVLDELSAPLAGRLAPGGSLILSGLLVDQCPRIAQLFASRQGLEIRAITTSAADSEWSCARLGTPGAP